MRCSTIYHKIGLELGDFALLEANGSVLSTFKVDEAKL